jgi:hypothetical protein
MSARAWRGFLWGMVATVAMTLTHMIIWAIAGRLTVEALTTKAMPSIIITHLLGPLPTGTHLLLASAIHLGYGGFWGAILFRITPRVTVWKGLGLGAFLYLGAHIFLSPLLGHGGIMASGEPHRAFLLLFSVATHVTYGATLGWLGWRDDRSGPALKASSASAV